MVDAQPRSAECRVPIRLHNNSRFGRQRNGGLFGLEPVSKSWARGAADCSDMTSGIAARLGYRAPIGWGRDNTFQAESRVASPAGSCLCNFFL